MVQQRFLGVLNSTIKCNRATNITPLGTATFSLFSHNKPQYQLTFGPTCQPKVWLSNATYTKSPIVRSAKGPLLSFHKYNIATSLGNLSLSSLHTQLSLLQSHPIHSLHSPCKPITSLGLNGAPVMEYATSSKPREKTTFRLLRYPKLGDAGNDTSRPIIVLLPWLNAKPKNIAKYVQYYQMRGYSDIISTSATPIQFLLPRLSFPISENLCAELQSPEYVNRPIIIHSFSVGTYLLSVLFHQMIEDPDKFSPISSRIVGFVGDSLTIGGPKKMAHGVVESLTQSPLYKVLGKAAIMTYFNLTHRWTVKLYEEFLESFYNHPIPQAPCLYFYSHNDPMCDPDQMAELIQHQKEKGYTVYHKDWPESRHAMHFVNHNREYEAKLTEFLKTVDPGNKKLFKARL